MNEFRNLDFITAASDENIQRIIAERSQNDEILLMNRQHDDLRDAMLLRSQLGTDTFDPQAVLHGLTHGCHVPAVDLHDSRLDVARHIENERRKANAIQREFQIQEELQLREELVKRKIKEEFEQLEQQRELRKIASDRLLLSQFNGMENLVARQEMLQFQSEIANSVHRNDQSSMMNALGLLGQNGLDSEHFGLRKNSPSVLSDALDLSGNFGVVANTDTLNDLAHYPPLHQSNLMGDFAAHPLERDFDTSLADLVTKNRMASTLPRVAHQNHPVDAISLIEEGCGLTKSLPPFFHNNAHASDNSIQSSLHSGNFTGADLEQQIQQAILPNNYDHLKKRIKLASNSKNENEFLMPKRLLSAEIPRNSGGERVPIESSTSHLSSNDIRYFNNGNEVSYSGAPILSSNSQEKHVRHGKYKSQSSSPTTLVSSSSEIMNLAPVPEAANQSKQFTLLNEIPSNCGASLPLEKKQVCEKKNSPDSLQVNSRERIISSTPESVPLAITGDVSSSCSKSESSLKKRNEKRARDDSPPGPHSDLIIEVFGSKRDSSELRSECTPALEYDVKARNKTAEERENALTAASALLGFMKP